MPTNHHHPLLQGMGMGYTQDMTWKLSIGHQLDGPGRHQSSQFHTIQLSAWGWIQLKPSRLARLKPPFARHLVLRRTLTEQFPQVEDKVIGMLQDIATLSPNWLLSWHGTGKRLDPPRGQIPMMVSAGSNLILRLRQKGP